eukprot:s193_g17.t1
MFFSEMQRWLPRGWTFGKKHEFSELLLDEPSTPESVESGVSPRRELGRLGVSASATLSLSILLIGWMSPQYAQKLGAFHIHDLLANTPVIAALVVQSSWSLLALVPFHCGLKSQSADSQMPQGPGALQEAGPLRFVSFLSLPAVGRLWLVAIPLSLCATAMHSMWYSSFTQTTPAVNTLVWNLDIVIAMLLEAIVTRRVPSIMVILGGCITLFGAFLATDAEVEGNSLSGCVLCLTATTLYSLVAIIVSSLDCEVTQLLALEGLYSLAVLTALQIFSTALPGASGSAFVFTNLSGSAGFLSMNDLMLNLGWLSCSKLMGASQTAMVACLSIPLSLLLDAMLLGAVPSTPEVTGSSLAIVGFFLSYTRGQSEDSDVAVSACASTCTF